MLQRAASNAYSWWWASHIRTKQSKWLEQNLLDMEEKVHNTLKLIEEDGDSFAKRAEMYYKKRPELINFVEESYRAYRSLAERYDHISTELQNANNTIATIFPEQVQFAMDEEDEYASPRFPKKFPVAPRTDIPKVPKGPIKDLRSAITTATATKKFQSKKTSKAATSKSKAPKSGLSKPRALEDIDRFQKQILALQTEKEFMKSSYESGLAKYWEIEKQIKELQEKVCKLQDEFGEGMVIEDDDARSLMATAALKSCQETLTQLQEKQEKSTEEAKFEYQRIKAVWEKLVSLKDKYHSDQIDEENRNGNNESGNSVRDLKPLEPEIGIPTEERQKLELIREKIKEHFEAGSNFTVTEMAEKIDELVNKVISLESAVSSQTALVKRLRNETDELQAQLQTLEDDKATLVGGKNTLINKVKEMEEKFQGVQDLNQSFSEQNSNLQTHFTEANCNLDHLSEKLQTVKLDEKLEVTGSSEISQGSLSEDKLPKQFEEQEDALNPLEGFKTQQGKKSGEELKVTAPLQKEQGSPGELSLFEAMEKQEAASQMGNGSSPSEVKSVEELKEQEAAPGMGNGSSPAEVVTLQGLKEQKAEPNLGTVSYLAEVRSLQELKEHEVAPNLGNVSSSVVARSLEELNEHESATNLGNFSSPGITTSFEELKEHEAAPNLGNVSSPAVAVSLEELKEQETAPDVGKGSYPAVARSLEELEEHEAAPNTGNASSQPVMRSVEQLKQQETAPNIGNDSFPVDVRSPGELKQQEEAAPNMGNASFPGERSQQELKVQEAAPAMGSGSSPTEVRSVEQLKEQEDSSNMGEGSGNVRETLSTSAGDQQEKCCQSGENNKADNELPNLSNMQTSSQTVDDSPQVEPQEQETENKDEPDWQKMFLNGIENREKILLTEYTATLRNFKDVKKKLNEVEKKTQDSTFETSVQLKNLKSANAKKDEEIRSLRLKLSLLQQSMEEDMDSKYLKASELENSKTPIYEKEDIDAMLIDQSSTNMSEIEEKFRMDIDALLEENLDFWLKFSTSFHQIQKFETEVKDLQSEVSKLEDKRKNQEGSSTLKHLLKSDARPLYKHLREIQTELTVWLEKSVLLKDEMQCRFTSLCNIQEEITQALKTSAEDDEFKFTSYQAAKFQGEVLNMKQENNKVADELQAALDHVTTLQLEVDKTLSKLNEEFALSGSRKQQEPQLSHSESHSRVPLRSFIFGVKPKKQKSIFSCVAPAMHKKYHGLRAGPPL